MSVARVPDKKYWDEADSLSEDIVGGDPMRLTRLVPQLRRRERYWLSPKPGQIDTLHEFKDRLLLGRITTWRVLGLLAPINAHSTKGDPEGLWEVTELEFRPELAMLRVWRGIGSPDYRMTGAEARERVRMRAEDTQAGRPLPAAEDYERLIDELRYGAREAETFPIR